MTQLHVPEAVRLPEPVAQAQSPLTQVPAAQSPAAQSPAGQTSASQLSADQSAVAQSSQAQSSQAQSSQAQAVPGQMGQDAPAPPGLPPVIAQGIPQGVAIQGTAMGFPEQLSMHPMIMAGGLGLVVLLMLAMAASNIRRRRRKLECRRINALSAQFSGSR